MFKIHNNELAENTKIPYELLILLIINHFSKTKILTGPLTAISVMVMNGIIIIKIYVNDPNSRKSNLLFNSKRQN